MIDISSGLLRKEVFALVYSVENSSTDYAKQYAYIEDIGDGRGSTAGMDNVRRCVYLDSGTN